jgi:predicted N-acetyltransferase YhbS
MTAVSAPNDNDPLVIDLEAPGDAAAVAALVDAAFGPGRWAKTAERLREHNTPIEGLSFVAREAGRITGSVRLWPVLVGETPVAFLGPIAVDGSQRNRGLGAMLVERACAAAEAAGVKAVLLVGDPYFERFGFVRCQARLPGPVDQRRVMIKVFSGGPIEGPVRRP